ncbi:hypothetical protein Cob_v006716 [Colletotrichum orbiculare MAFF 240422]|uniref:Uncharacterized protein n=1 Tax=Colletotrichum orbiculare (strain 104-T / ATCC 96160 / CBS 514.97 / LARS 414 / MAFF 240422) TaxID=1213857 RepID=N4V8S6_COLOR|nr:hypothetical protein Cob_v006716 [Colletotrichum orbiculare MAFF 240422]
MVGQITYAYNEVCYILTLVVRKEKPTTIAAKYQQHFGKALSLQQVRYVKTKYGHDPEFGAVMVNGLPDKGNVGNKKQTPVPGAHKEMLPGLNFGSPPPSPAQEPLAYGPSAFSGFGQRDAPQAPAHPDADKLEAWHPKILPITHHRSKVAALQNDAQTVPEASPNDRDTQTQTSDLTVGAPALTTLEDEMLWGISPSDFQALIDFNNSTDLPQREVVEPEVAESEPLQIEVDWDTWNPKQAYGYQPIMDIMVGRSPKRDREEDLDVSEETEFNSIDENSQNLDSQDLDDTDVPSPKRLKVQSDDEEPEGSFHSAQTNAQAADSHLPHTPQQSSTGDAIANSDNTVIDNSDSTVTDNSDNTVTDNSIGADPLNDLMNTLNDAAEAGKQSPVIQQELDEEWKEWLLPELFLDESHHSTLDETEDRARHIQNLFDGTALEHGQRDPDAQFRYRSPESRDVEEYASRMEQLSREAEQTQPKYNPEVGYPAVDCFSVEGRKIAFAGLNPNRPRRILAGGLHSPVGFQPYEPPKLPGEVPERQPPSAAFLAVADGLKACTEAQKRREAEAAASPWPPTFREHFTAQSSRPKAKVPPRPHHKRPSSPRTGSGPARRRASKMYPPAPEPLPPFFSRPPMAYRSPYAQTPQTAPHARPAAASPSLQANPFLVPQGNHAPMPQTSLQARLNAAAHRLPDPFVSPQGQQDPMPQANLFASLQGQHALSPQSAPQARPNAFSSREGNHPGTPQPKRASKPKKNPQARVNPASQSQANSNASSQKQQASAPGSIPGARPHTGAGPIQGQQTASSDNQQPPDDEPKKRKKRNKKKKQPELPELPMPSAPSSYFAPGHAYYADRLQARGAQDQQARDNEPGSPIHFDPLDYLRYAPNLPVPMPGARVSGNFFDPGAEMFSRPRRPRGYVDEEDD